MNERCYTANTAIPRRPRNPWCYELALTESELAIHESVTQPFRPRDLELAAEVQPRETVTMSASPTVMSYPSFIVLLYAGMAFVLGVSLWSARDLFSMTELGLLGWCAVLAGGVIVDGCGKAIERLYDLTMR